MTKKFLSDNEETTIKNSYLISLDQQMREVEGDTKMEVEHLLDSARAVSESTAQNKSEIVDKH